MFIMSQPKKPTLLNISNMSNDKFMIYYIMLMQSKRKNNINIGFHASYESMTRYGCTCKKSDSHAPIGSSKKIDMGLTPSPRL